MDNVGVPWPLINEITFIQEDLKPGGMSLILGNNKIAEAKADSWRIIAGSEAGASGFADGDGNATLFNNPMSLFQLNEDEIVIADTNNHCLRHLMRTNKNTSIFAGRCQTSGDFDGDWEAAIYGHPMHVAKDLKSPDHLIVLDVNANNGFPTKIRQVDIRSRHTNSLGNCGAVMCSLRSFVQDPSTFDFYATSKSHEIHKLPYDNIGASTVIAGSGSAGFQEGDGNTNSAKFSYPAQLIFFDNDTLLIADKGNGRLRMYELTTDKSDSICNGGSPSTVCAPLDTCNIESPVSLYMSEGNLYAATITELYVIKCKLFM